MSHCGYIIKENSLSGQVIYLLCKLFSQNLLSATAVQIYACLNGIITEKKLGSLDIFFRSVTQHLMQPEANYASNPERKVQGLPNMIIWRILSSRN